MTETATRAAEAQSAADPDAIEGPAKPKVAKKKALVHKPAPVVHTGPEKKSKLDDITKKLRAGYSVDDVKKFQSKAKAPAKKPAAKAIKKKPVVKKPAAPSAAIPDRNDVSEELAAEQAQREANSPPAQEDA